MVLPMQDPRMLMQGPAPMPGPPPMPMPGPMPGGPMMPPPQPAAMAMPPDPMMGPMGAGDLIGGGPDIMGMLQDPVVLMLVLQMLSDTEKEEEGPVYPKWFDKKDYPKPDVGDVISKAHDDKALYSELVKRIGQDRLIYLIQDVGKFADFDHLAEITFSDPSLAQDSALVVNLVATTDTNYEARAKVMDEAEIAEKKEQTAHALDEKWKRRHALMHGTDLDYDETKTAVTTGHLVARFSLDFDAEYDDPPVNMDLLDPATCFPTWDGQRGMKTMTRVYNQPIDQVIATWETDDHDVTGKVLNKKVKDENGYEHYRTLKDTVEVVEYWDRGNYVIAVDGEEIINTEHDYGEVPFEYMRSPFGDSGITNIEAITSGKRVDAGYGIAMKGMSHIWASKASHSQREAIMGRLMTELKKTANPDRTFEQSPNRYGETPQINNMEGGVSLLMMGEEKEVAGPPKPGLSLVSPLMGVINEGVQRSLMPASAYGLTQNANESGTAIEGLNESGRDKLTAWLRMKEAWRAAGKERAFRMIRDHGRILGSEGRRGEFEIARQKPKPGEDMVITITPSELRQVGCHIRAKCTSLRLSNLASLGNALTVWKQNGWLEDVEALEMRGVQDPIAAKRRIQIERFESSDVYRDIGLIKYYEEEGMIDEAIMARQILMGGGNGGGGQQGGPPGGQPPGPPGGPGVNGGAPPGMPMGPQGASPQMGAMGTQGRLPGPPPNLGGPGIGQVGV